MNYNSPKANWDINICKVNSILGDPRAVSGGRESLNGREKNSAKKSREGEEEPLRTRDQFQTVEVVLVSDWWRKTFVFFTQSQSRNTRSRFVFSCTKDTYMSFTLVRFSRVYSRPRRRVPITAQNVVEIVRYIREKLVGNKLDLLQVSQHYRL